MTNFHSGNVQFESQFLPGDRERIDAHSATQAEMEEARHIMQAATQRMGINLTSAEITGTVAKILGSVPERVMRSEEGEILPEALLLEACAILGKDVGSLVERINATRNSVMPLLSEPNAKWTWMKDLPIVEHAANILDTVAANNVTLIRGPTGSGKSLMVPEYLMQDGYRVIVTQPRVIAATSLARFKAEQMNVPLGSEIGYRTAMYKNASRDTRLLYCTDGLQLVRELLGQSEHGITNVLVIDEVHEWNINIETLIAWAKKQLGEGAKFKIVLMSATMDTDDLAAFMGDEEKSAPLIDVEGRLFPVEESQKAPNELIGEVARLVAEKRNVLVFQPGKKEIERTILALKEAGVDAMILPLHSELDPVDQEQVFAHYDRPKVVIATTIAQTSITIDDIDAVVDSGLERRVETVSGVEGLYLKDISRADCKQRAGRAGRTKPGVYILCSHTSMEQRDAYSKPEIQRVRLDQTVLRLATIGIDATDMKFFHPLDSAALKEAKRALTVMGAMDGQAKVTQLGREISFLPIDIHLGRMVIEAVKHQCVDEVLTIAACMEAGGINDRTQNWRALTAETESDALAQLDLFRAASGMSNTEMREKGIFAKAFYRAKEVIGHVRRSLPKDWMTLHPTSDTREERFRADVLKSVVAGMVDNLYRHDYGDEYKRQGDERTKGRESVVSTNPQWLVGLPKDISYMTKRGGSGVMPILNMCSAVDPSWLVNIAPQLVRTERRNLQWDNHAGRVTEDIVTTFNGNEINTQTTLANPGTSAVRYFCEILQRGYVEYPVIKEVNTHNWNVIRETEKWQCRSSGQIHKITPEDVAEFYAKILEPLNIVTTADLANHFPDVTHAEKLKIKLDDIIPPPEQAKIMQDNPDQIMLSNQSAAVEYVWKWGDYYAVIKLTSPQVQQLTPADFNGIAFPGKKILYSLTDTHLEVATVEQLYQGIENNRLSSMWEEFQKTHPETHFTLEADRPLPPLPASEIYDQQTGAKAYPGHKRVYEEIGFPGDSIITVAYVIAWFDTIEKAQAAEDTVEQAQKKLEQAAQAAAERQRIKEQYYATVAEIRILADHLDALEPSSTQRHYRIHDCRIIHNNTDLNRVFDFKEYLAEATQALARLKRYEEEIEEEKQDALRKKKEPEALSISSEDKVGRESSGAQEDAILGIFQANILQALEGLGISQDDIDNGMSSGSLFEQEGMHVRAYEQDEKPPSTQGKSPDGRCGMRSQPAWIIRTLDVPGGRINAWLYRYSGKWHINLRFDPPSVAISVTDASTEPGETAEPASGSFAASKAKLITVFSSSVANAGRGAEYEKSKQSRSVHIQPQPKKKEPEHVLKATASTPAKEKPAPAAPVLPSVDAMTEDELLQEYDANDQRINTILAEYPDLETSFNELQKAQDEMTAIRPIIKSAKETCQELRESKDTKTKKKAADFLREKEERQTELRTVIDALIRQTKSLEKVQEELKRLRERQSAIEAKM